MKRVIVILALLFLSAPIHAQEQERVEIYFDQGSSIIDRGHAVNGEMLDKLADDLSRIISSSEYAVNRIEINSYTSPEGGLRLNNALSLRRAQVVHDYIMGLNLDLPESKIEVKSNGIAWEGLREFILASDLECKYDLVITIDAVPVETWARVSPDDEWLALVDSRLKRLMDYDDGRPYKYMYDNIFPKLRNSSLITIYYDEAVPVEEEPEEEVAEPEESEPESDASDDEGEGDGDDIKPLFAIKTNLLFDVATLLNIELEVPIGQHWSIAGEWVFPWWSSCGNKNNSWQSGSDSHRNTLQLLNGNLEGKYWFGDRTDRLAMTGWHLGLYAGGGLYDLERNAEGYQGEFFIMAGLSGGYAHTINKSGSLRMEYSVAVGYLKTDYDKYAEHWGIDDSWHTIRQESGNYTWIGPTRARVSLVWMLNRKVNKEK